MFADYDLIVGTNSVANIYSKLFLSMVNRGHAQVYSNAETFLSSATTNYDVSSERRMFADYDHDKERKSVANIYRNLFLSLVNRGHA